MFCQYFIVACSLHNKKNMKNKLKKLENIHRKRTMSDWLKIIVTCCQKIIFPRPPKENSMEYQHYIRQN
jgi:hypothetical protein